MALHWTGRRIKTSDTISIRSFICYDESQRAPPPAVFQKDRLIVPAYVRVLVPLTETLCLSFHFYLGCSPQSLY